MRKRLLLLLAGAALLVGGYLLGRTWPQVVHAQTQFTISSSFGHCVGYVTHKGADGLIFEASDGTVRLDSKSRHRKRNNICPSVTTCTG